MRRAGVGRWRNDVGGGPGPGQWRRSRRRRRPGSRRRGGGGVGVGGVGGVGGPRRRGRRRCGGARGGGGRAGGRRTRGHRRAWRARRGRAEGAERAAVVPRPSRDDPRRGIFPLRPQAFTALPSAADGPRRSGRPCGAILSQFPPTENLPAAVALGTTRPRRISPRGP